VAAGLARWPRLESTWIGQGTLSGGAHLRRIAIRQPRKPERKDPRTLLFCLSWNHSHLWLGGCLELLLRPRLRRLIRASARPITITGFAEGFSLSSIFDFPALSPCQPVLFRPPPAHPRGRFTSPRRHLCLLMRSVVVLTFVLNPVLQAAWQNGGRAGELPQHQRVRAEQEACAVERLELIFKPAQGGRQIV